MTDSLTMWTELVGAIKAITTSKTRGITRLEAIRDLYQTYSHRYFFYDREGDDQKAKQELKAALDALHSSTVLDEMTKGALRLPAHRQLAAAADIKVADFFGETGGTLLLPSPTLEQSRLQRQANSDKEQVLSKALAEVDYPSLPRIFDRESTGDAIEKEIDAELAKIKPAYDALASKAKTFAEQIRAGKTLAASELAQFHKDREAFRAQRKAITSKYGSYLN